MRTLDLMKQHDNWREILTQAPYKLSIKEKGDLVLLKYNQLESDMDSKIVQECRGVIINVKDMSVVCRPFDKFFNASQPQAATLIGKIRAEEKVDGSIMKMYFYQGEWRLATNGMIDAADATLQMSSDDVATYQDLFNVAFAKYVSGDKMAELDEWKDYTLIFELVSPINRIVVAYPETDLKLLGIRHNATGKEIVPRDTSLARIFKTPNLYDIDTLEQALEIAKTLGGNEEGFILVDEYFNRVKVKGTEYLALHKMRSNSYSLKGFLEVVLNDSQDDLVAYFPEYTPFITDIESKIKQLISDIETEISAVQFDADRKEFALQIKDKPYSSMLFKLYGNANYDWKGELLNPDNINRLIRMLGL